MFHRSYYVEPWNVSCKLLEASFLYWFFTFIFCFFFVVFLTKTKRNKKIIINHILIYIYYLLKTFSHDYRYSGHYFVTTLLYSILLGFLGVDRFCLGHTGAAVGKLLTIGGLGIWWFVDIILLVIGELQPADGSSWNPYY